MDEILTQAIEIAKITTGDNVGKSFSLIGIIALLFGLYLGYQIVNKEPSAVSHFDRYLTLSLIILGFVFSIAGPAYPLVMRLDYFKNAFAKEENITQRMNNLRRNRTVHTVIRLVVYDPATEANLKLSTLQYLGQREQKYTFVADYDELKGLTFKEAAARIGVKLHPGQRITAIIFPAPDPIIPANARGILKIVQLLEKTATGEPKLNVEQRLGNADIAELDRHGQSSYAFDNYSKRFSDYCKIASEFRCASGDKQYAVAPMIGKISEDWEYLGYARTDDPEAVCNASTIEKECHIDNWDQAKEASRDRFGVRVFLVENSRLIDEIPERIMIDVDRPDNQTIPFYMDSNFSTR